MTKRFGACLMFGWLGGWLVIGCGGSGGHPGNGGRAGTSGGGRGGAAGAGDRGGAAAAGNKGGAGGAGVAGTAGDFGAAGSSGGADQTGGSGPGGAPSPPGPEVTGSGGKGGDAGSSSAGGATTPSTGGAPNSGGISGSGGGAGQGGTGDAGQGGRAPNGGGADWIELDPLDSPASFAGLQSAVPASTGGGVELMFAAATPGASRYFLFVRPQGGTYDFQRAYAVVWPDQVNYVGGLATERTWCFTVRFDGNANTTEACATPAVAAPQTEVPTFVSGPAPAWADSPLDLQWSVRAGASYRYDLERRSSGGAYEVRVSKTHRATTLAPSDGVPVTFTDTVDAPGSYDYRLRAFADGVETGLSAVKTIDVVKKAWRQPLERAARIVSGSRLSPRVAVDGGGSLVYGEYASAAPAAQFLAGMRRVSSVRQGPAIAGNPEPWRRLLEAYDDVGVLDPLNLWIAWARGADGTLWVLDSSQALIKIGTSGAGEIWNTSIHEGAFNLVAHPTDPAKLAVAGPKGVWVSSDGGVTFRLFSDVAGTSASVAYAPDGTLFSIGTHLAESTDNGLTWSNYAAWPGPPDAPSEMAMSPDGSVMAVSLAGGLPRAGVWVGPPGGMLTYSDAGLSAEHAWTAGGLTFLPDNRLVLVSTSPDGGDAARPAALASVRAPAGTWTTFELPGAWTADGGPQVPVFFDLRPGHEGDYYHARLRTRDGGATWELDPAGRAVGATTSGGQFVLLTVQQRDAAAAVTSYRSLDGGDTATPLAGVALPADGSIWFNPASPFTGVTAAGTYTADGGATWAPSSMGASWAGVGFADAGHVLGTPFNASPLRSTDGGASFAPLDTIRSNTACGNGAQALLVRNTAGSFLSYTSTAQQTVTTTMASPGSIRACGLAADGRTVYLLTSTALWKGKSGVAGSLTRLALPPTAVTSGLAALVVSPDGMKVSARGSYSETGGE